MRVVFVARQPGSTLRSHGLDHPGHAFVSFACCRISVRKTSLEIPTPPALAKFFEYCSVSIERHGPVPGVSPNGPSPFKPLVICENIALRNVASKSVACALAL